MQEFYSNRIGNSIALFWTRGFSLAVQYEQTTPKSDVIMLYNICQLSELKSPIKTTSANFFETKYNAAILN